MAVPLGGPAETTPITQALKPTIATAHSPNCDALPSHHSSIRLTPGVGANLVLHLPAGIQFSLVRLHYALDEGPQAVTTKVPADGKAKFVLTGGLLTEGVHLDYAFEALISVAPATSPCFGQQSAVVPSEFMFHSLATTQADGNRMPLLHTLLHAATLMQAQAWSQGKSSEEVCEKYFVEPTPCSYSAGGGVSEDDPAPIAPPTPIPIDLSLFYGVFDQPSPPAFAPGSACDTHYEHPPITVTVQPLEDPGLFIDANYARLIENEPLGSNAYVDAVWDKRVDGSVMWALTVWAYGGGLDTQDYARALIEDHNRLGWRASFTCTNTGHCSAAKTTAHVDVRVYWALAGGEQTVLAAALAPGEESGSAASITLDAFASRLQPRSAVTPRQDPFGLVPGGTRIPGEIAEVADVLLARAEGAGGSYDRVSADKHVYVPNGWIPISGNAIWRNFEFKYDEDHWAHYVQAANLVDALTQASALWGRTVYGGALADFDEYDPDGPMDYRLWLDYVTYTSCDWFDQ